MTEDIQQQLLNEDPEVRLRALKDLQGREKDLQVAVPFYIRGLEDDNWRIRKTAVQILVTIGGEFVIQQLLKSLYRESANARNSAIEALVELGPKATDYLIQEFKHANADVKKFIVDIIGSTRDLKAFPLLFATLENEDENIRASVVEHLGNIKKNAAVVDALITLAEKEDVWTAFHAVNALGRIGDIRATDALISVLSKKDLRKSAISALGEIASANAIPFLVPFLKDESKSVREEAVKALALLLRKGMSEDVIVEQIQNMYGGEALQVVQPHTQSNKQDVKTAALLLSGLLRDVASLAPLLELAVTEERNEPFIRLLVFMGRSMPGALAPFFKTDDLYQRRLVCRIAGQIAAPELFEPLAECLKDKDGHVRGKAALALANLNDPKAVDYIKPLMFDEYENIREEAVTALSKLKKWLNLEDIMKGLSDNNPATRRITALLLGLLEDDRAVEGLGGVLRDSDVRVRKTAVESLGVLDSRKVLPYLITAVQDESPEIRRISALEMGDLRSREAVDALIPLLQDSHAWVRAAAVTALGKIGSKETEEPLIQLLSDNSGLVKIAVVDALGSFRHDRSKHVLLQLLHDEDPEIRCAAADSLVSFGGIMQHLLPLLKDREWSVRKEVVDILGKSFRDEGLMYLKEVADTDEDSQVRETAEDYLHG